MLYIVHPADDDVDRLLWSSPTPAATATATALSSSSSVGNNGGSGPLFEFEFSDQSLPDIYRLSGDDANIASDDWVLFADVSAALSVKTVDALSKLLDNENAVMAVPADRFNERVVPKNVLGRQLIGVVSAANKPTAEQSSVKDDAAATTKCSDDASSVAVAVNAGGGGGGDDDNDEQQQEQQIHLVRYDRKLKQLLGVDVYTMS